MFWCQWGISHSIFFCCFSFQVEKNATPSLSSQTLRFPRRFGTSWKVSPAFWWTTSTVSFHCVTLTHTPRRRRLHLVNSSGWLCPFLDYLFPSVQLDYRWKKHFLQIPTYSMCFSKGHFDVQVLIWSTKKFHLQAFIRSLCLKINHYAYHHVSVILLLCTFPNWIHWQWGHNKHPVRALGGTTEPQVLRFLQFCETGKI